MKKNKRYRKYSVIRNYKKFKCEYTNFVLFIKCGKYYYTFDSDAKIMMCIYEVYRDTASFRIEKERFKEVVMELHKYGLNVALAGEKLSNEFYADSPSQYALIKKKSKEKYKSTISSVPFDEDYVTVTLVK